MSHLARTIWLVLLSGILIALIAQVPSQNGSGASSTVTGGITALTTDVTAAGSGSVLATVNGSGATQFMVKPAAAATTGSISIVPSTTATTAQIGLRNSSDVANYEEFRMSINGAGAGVFQLFHTGTPANPVTTIFLGESPSGAADLTDILFRFHGVTRGDLNSAGLLTIANLTLSALTTGIAHVGLSGALTSSPVALATEVSGLLPNANLANPSVTVNGVSCTLGGSCAVNATATNCSSSASPAVCGAAPSGSFALPASATTVTINTTAVTANSQIFIQDDASLGTKLSVTCNTTAPTSPQISARVAATSFTIIASAPSTNPACYSYYIVN